MLGVFDRNPITLVRRSAKCEPGSGRADSREIGKLPAELREPWRTAVYVASQLDCAYPNCSADITPYVDRVLGD